jgi:hypothetical protein
MRRNWGASINVAGDAKFEMKTDVDTLETKLMPRTQSRSFSKILRRIGKI